MMSDLNRLAAIANQPGSCFAGAAAALHTGSRYGWQHKRAWYQEYSPVQVDAHYVGSYFWALTNDVHFSPLQLLTWMATNAAS